MSEQNYEILSANAEKMCKLKKTFKIAFIISAVSPLLYTFWGLIKFASFIMTAGINAVSSGFVIQVALSVVSLVCFSFSYMLEKKATKASILLSILLAVIFITIGNELFCILSVIGSVTQILCLKQYPQIDYLKSQEGYPDFNTIVSSKIANRRFSDEELKNRTGGSEKNTDTAFTMEEVKLPSENNF